MREGIVGYLLRIEDFIFRRYLRVDLDISFILEELLLSGIVNFS